MQNTISPRVSLGDASRGAPLTCSTPLFAPPAPGTPFPSFAYPLHSLAASPECLPLTIFLVVRRCCRRQCLLGPPAVFQVQAVRLQAVHGHVLACV